MNMIRFLVLAAVLAAPPLAFGQSNSNPCVAAYNVTTGAFSCIPVGQPSPNITTINPLPVGGVANAVAPTFVEGRPGYLSFDLSGNLRTSGTFTPSSSSPEFTPVAPATATATVGVLNGCQYDSTQKTLTNGQQAAVSCSPRGAFFVAPGADGFAVTGTFFQATQPVSIASAQVASGAYASGAVASGAYASGSLASGAMVDLVALSAPVAPATATATKSILLGAQATTAAVNPTTGQQSALSSDTNNNLLTSSGGAPNLTTAQVTVTTSSTSTAAARALRRSVTITNITGTQQVYCSGTTATTGNGQLIPAVVGASWTVSTAAAVNCIAVSSSQTVSVAEIY